MRDHKNRSSVGVFHPIMNPEHEKLLEDFETFECDLEVEEILKKVKRDSVPDQGVTQFAEQLKERGRNGRPRRNERRKWNNSGRPAITRGSPVRGSLKGSITAATIGGTISRDPSRHRHQPPPNDGRSTSPATGSGRQTESQVLGQVPRESGRHEQTISGKESGQNCGGQETIPGNPSGTTLSQSKTMSGEPSRRTQ